MTTSETHPTALSTLSQPQAFPLYAVTEAAGTVCIVLGWQDGAPVLQPLAKSITTGPLRYEHAYQLHTLYDDAVGAAREIQQAKRQAQLRSGDDPWVGYWPTASAARRAAIKATNNGGKPFTEAQWRAALTVGVDAAGMAN